MFILSVEVEIISRINRAQANGLIGNHPETASTFDFPHIPRGATLPGKGFSCEFIHIPRSTLPSQHTLWSYGHG